MRLPAACRGLTSRKTSSWLLPVVCHTLRRALVPPMSPVTTYVPFRMRKGFEEGVCGMEGPRGGAGGDDAPYACGLPKARTAAGRLAPLQRPDITHALLTNLSAYCTT